MLADRAVAVGRPTPGVELAGEVHGRPVFAALLEADPWTLV